MTNFEWLSIIAAIIGGFWAVASKLNRIELAVNGRVSYKECSEKRDKCPCMIELEKIKKERKVQ